ncbi:5-formyltetrahydrofolate cyclo-ligase [Nitrosotalea sinensis]|uniref:5-formyltetrahydrofolate cyclo-ligase n=1 Tax=Nitrosotalea sinensis TaxID=1499975 RepID=A0A2H1EIY1_9ARCH|nr:5-formyltetrahydrofolate cyclo-ligase [Candidatus Nitrosotalea sinensis]SHO47070.1 5-formyltetrahydrofolate cyclo-ligase [Candidatus Nitrosotalea sinensis]
MSNPVEKSRLRKQILDARDSLSLDFIKIASSKIRDNLRKIDFYRQSTSIGVYYSIGSEVQTHELIQEFFNQGKEVALPRVEKNDIIFKKITSMSDLEMGSFSVMEPKEKCETVKKLDVILVPAIALTRDGYRLGYGFGFYDRYLHGKKSKKIGLAYAKHILKSFPHDDHDIKMDCIVTEDSVIYAK